jgi:hypothetical protein
VVSAARRCDPTEYLDWIAVYWLYDHSLLPEDSPLLTASLALIEEMFVSGDGLLVRRWCPDPVKADTVQGGKAVQRVRTDPRSGFKVVTTYDWR